ncbi:MAG: rRNA maturation RNase YbeY [Acidobacteriota bacterium]|nr:rRNA maturation RNase YbeY [Acidobacteriota bacterium]
MNSGPLITYRRAPATLNRSAIEAFAEVLRTRVGRGREFHCLITSDAELQALNKRFLRKDFPTDVLSFPSGATDPIGDIAISLQRARAQAREWAHSVEDELCILMLHGVLHLKGLDHEADSGRMARAEKRWRNKLGLPGGLIERAAR